MAAGRQVGRGGERRGAADGGRHRKPCMREVWQCHGVNSTKLLALTDARPAHLTSW